MKYRKILAAIKTDNEKSIVFERSVDIARIYNAQLMLYYCKTVETLVDPDQRIMSVSQDDGLWAEKAFNIKQHEIIEHEKAWLESLCVIAREKGVDAHCLVEEGQAGKQIVKFSHGWGADLIVMGRTERGSLADCLFGTVSDYVIHHASCSLLLVQ